MKSPLLSQLRDATRDAHEALDTGLDIQALSSSRDAYFDYLRAFRSGLAATCAGIDWEQVALAGLPNLDERKARYRSIFADLGEQVPSGLFMGQSSLAASIGALYVLEGSIHGGGQILTYLQNVDDLPLSFLKAFGARNAEVWRNFLSWMTGLDCDAKSREEACASANGAFAKFQESFSASGR